jgi:transcriptional regulator with XRE-family HTH domain
MSIDYAAICESLAALPPEARRRLVEEAAASGYAAKDLAEMMQVSAPAVSRYLNGSLAPSPGAICRLLMSIDPATRTHLLVTAARFLWRLLASLLDQLPPTPQLEALLTEIADHVSDKLAQLHVANTTEG